MLPHQKRTGKRLPSSARTGKPYRAMHQAIPHSGLLNLIIEKPHLTLETNNKRGLDGALPNLGYQFPTRTELE